MVLWRMNVLEVATVVEPTAARVRGMRRSIARRLEGRRGTVRQREQMRLRGMRRAECRESPRRRPDQLRVRRARRESEGAWAKERAVHGSYVVGVVNVMGLTDRMMTRGDTGLGSVNAAEGLTEVPSMAITVMTSGQRLEGPLVVTRIAAARPSGRVPVRQMSIMTVWPVDFLIPVTVGFASKALIPGGPTHAPRRYLHALLDNRVGEERACSWEQVTRDMPLPGMAATWMSRKVHKEVDEGGRLRRWCGSCRGRGGLLDVPPASG